MRCIALLIRVQDLKQNNDSLVNTLVQKHAKEVAGLKSELEQKLSSNLATMNALEAERNVWKDRARTTRNDFTHVDKERSDVRVVLLQLPTLVLICAQLLAKLAMLESEKQQIADANTRVHNELKELMTVIDSKTATVCHDIRDL